MCLCVCMQSIQCFDAISKEMLFQMALHTHLTRIDLWRNLCDGNVNGETWLVLQKVFRHLTHRNHCQITKINSDRRDKSEKHRFQFYSMECQTQL